ncbi:MAG: hypothetical protein ABI550_08300, partial [Ignavibacteriaceae bacterium]
MVPAEWSNRNMIDAISKLKSITRKKNRVGKLFEYVLIKFSGADSVIAEILPEDEKDLLLRIGIINICFFIFAMTGIGYILFFSIENWIFLVLLMVVATVFSFCLRTSISARLLHSKKQPRAILVLKWGFVLLCFVISLAGVAMWIFSNQIGTLAKHPYYEREYNRYRGELVNIDSVNYVDSSKDEYSVLNFLANNKENRGLKQIELGLNQKKNEISALIPSYYQRISYDDSVKNTFITREQNKTRYVDILPYSFTEKDMIKAGKTLHTLSGITFISDSIGNIVVLQNYYDSIYLARSQIDSIYTTQNILNFLLKKTVNEKYEKSTPDYYITNNKDFERFYAIYFFDNIVNNESFLRIQSATKSWLHRQFIINNNSISPADKVMGFYVLVSPNQSGLIFVIILLFFISTIIYQLVKSNLNDLKESKYPVLVTLYHNLELTRIESIQDGLSEIISSSSNVKFKTNDEIKHQAKSRLTQLRNFGTIGYYMQSGQEFEDIGDYNTALEKYSKGFEIFPEEYEFLKRRADVFLKMNDVNQSLEYLKLYNEKRNLVTVENNLKRRNSIAFFEMNEHPFYGTLLWPLNKQMNILLGKNGYGKSHLLSILLALVQNDIEKTKEFSSPNPTSQLKNEITKSEDTLVAILASAEDFPLNEEQMAKLETVTDKTQYEALKESFQEAYNKISFSSRGLNSLPGKIPVLAISDARFIDKSPNLLSRSIEHIDILLDSAKHFLYQKPYGSVIENALYRVCQSYLERKDINGKMVIIDIIEKIFYELTGNHFKLKEIKSNNNTDY